MRIAGTAALIVILALAAALLVHSPWSYAAQDRSAVSAEVSANHLLGTDELGRDRAARIGAAVLLGIAGAVAASACASVLAVSVGGAAAFAPGWIRRGLLYTGDLFLTLPWLFLLMMVRAALPLTLPPGQSAAITFLLLAMLGVPAFLRVHCTRTSAVRRAEWMLYARAGGMRPAQVSRQMLPHLRPLLLTQFLLYIPACLIAEANLGVLGLGISEPLPSWGSMLQSMQSAAFLNPSRLIYVPMVVLVLVLTSLDLLLSGSQEASR